MKVTFAIPPVSASNVERYHRCRTDRNNARAAGIALAHLRQLVQRLTAHDLLRAAAAERDPLAYLRGLAATLERSIAELAAERTGPDACLAADAAERNRLDLAAMERSSAVRQEAAGQRQTVAGILAGRADARKQLTEAGVLSPAEIEALLAAREAGTPSPVEEAEARAVQHDAVVAKLDAFLSDPMRDRSLLGPKLTADLEEHAKSIVARGNYAATEAVRLLERRHKLLKTPPPGRPFAQAR